MILGLSIESFTWLHVALSLVGIATGLVALVGMLRSATPGLATHVFLATTAATTITGFLFPITAFTPALGVGVISLLLLVAAYAAFYGLRLGGASRWVYVATAIAALYLNCFVLVVQAFQKIPALAALAPTQSEAPFVAALGLLLVAFLWFGWRATRSFHPVGLVPA
ncbi:conserved membrane protein of unknown function [Hyphomicrobium sp. 1Nfss2.1]|uniref:hypothetical protein n=1 Tax=Hyphomicrobium sp. 1Nfss2.1 TaxID=3413936 RepID=UPI003C7D40C6